MNNYDLPKLRRALITMLAKSIRSDKFYKEDYESICKAVNSKTRKELIQCYSNQVAIENVSVSEIRLHCQISDIQVRNAK